MKVILPSWIRARATRHLIEREITEGAKGRVDSTAFGNCSRYNTIFTDINY